MKAGTLWPVALTGVLAVTIGANVWMLYVANAQDAAVVEPDYYRKAVHWDEALAQERLNAELGWSIAAQLGQVGADGAAALEVRITDDRGGPVAGARVRVTAIHNRAGKYRPEALLDEVAPGFYRATLPLGRRGLWELRFEAERGGDPPSPSQPIERFTASVRREAN